MQDELRDIQRTLMDILQRVTAVETKIEKYNHLRERLDVAFNTAYENKEDIESMQKDRKWLRRTSIGALITSTAAAMVTAAVAILIKTLGGG